MVRLDYNRQAIQDQYRLQIVEGPDGKPTVQVVAYVPNVDQAFGGVFTADSPPPGRDQPACEETDLPWEGQLRAVRNGQVTDQPLAGGEE